VLFSPSAQNISPLDDLAFDMYQDPEVAQIIRKLETKKQEAALRKCKLSVADLTMNWDISLYVNFPAFTDKLNVCSFR